MTIFSFLRVGALAALAFGQTGEVLAQTTAAAGGSAVSNEGAKPRVCVAESDSWQTTGGAGGSGGVFGGTSAGGARPQTAEVIKTVGQRCPGVIVNDRQEASDYVLRLEHEGGKPMVAHKDKVAVFAQRTGDSIFSTSTRSVGAAVKDSCAAILAHWEAHGRETAAGPVQGGGASAGAVVVPAAGQMATLTVDASVPNSDIEIDGSFVGSTPSTVSVVAGQHRIVVKKKGYADWSRTMNVSGSGVRVSAEMEAGVAGK